MSDARWALIEPVFTAWRARWTGPGTLGCTTYDPGSDSDLSITFTTGSAGNLTGAPLNRTTRKIRLVGVATFDGGSLNGEEGTLRRRRRAG